MNPESYYLMEFEREAEAAALLAALSRYLNSPAGDDARSRTVEIRGWVGERGARLYLNAAALAAVDAAFSPLPRGVSCYGIPPKAAVLLTSESAACGLEEALRLLRRSTFA